MCHSAGRYQTGCFATIVRPRRNRFSVRLLSVLATAIATFHLRIDAHCAVVSFDAVQICRWRARGISDLFINAISLSSQRKDIYTLSRSIFAKCTSTFPIFTFDKPKCGNFSNDKLFSSPPIYMRAAATVANDMPSPRNIITFFARFGVLYESAAIISRKYFCAFSFQKVISNSSGLAGVTRCSFGPGANEGCILRSCSSSASKSTSTSAHSKSINGFVNRKTQTKTHRVRSVDTTHYSSATCLQTSNIFLPSFWIWAKINWIYFISHASSVSIQNATTTSRQLIRSPKKNEILY